MPREVARLVADTPSASWLPDADQLWYNGINLNLEIEVFLMKVSVLFASLIVIVLVAAFSLPAFAQDAITVTKDEHTHVFAESMTFSLAATSSSPIDSVKLFYRVSGQTSANKVELDFDASTLVDVEYTEDMADEENYQPPMISFTYWWLISDQAGNRLKTDPISFVYVDTHYEWQVLENEFVRLYWHDQDADFGQHFFDLATETVGALGAEFDVTPDDVTAIVIYNSHRELMEVLREGSAEWTGAVTFGESGCIAIGLGDMEWMNRVVPHELTHAVLYMVTKPPFGDIPRWLHEGLAMRSEGGMSLEEQLSLEKAIRDDELISLRVLNSPFADQRDRAILSYAESNSLVNYIIEVYGTKKLGELIAIFAEGAHYDDAVMEVFGVDMDGLEDLWREHIGAQPRTGTTRATPVATATPVPTATFTPPPVPTQENEPTATAESVPTNTPQPTPTPTRVIASATATSTPVAEPIATPVSVERPACLGAVPAIGLLVLFALCRPRGRPGSG